MNTTTRPADSQTKTESRSRLKSHSIALTSTAPRGSASMGRGGEIDTPRRFESASTKHAIKMMY